MDDVFLALLIVSSTLLALVIAALGWVRDRLG